MVITLLTDFGQADGFVGAMKGVILSRAPRATLVDLAHGLEPGDIATASDVLGATAPFFPSETIHVVVVDPGVGTARRAVAVVAEDQYYVAPDNGALTDVVAAAGGRVAGVILDNPAFWQHPVAPTFHGRDVLAPVAAHLAAGVQISALGSPLEPASLVRLPRPEPVASDGEVTGVIVRFDRFGNAATNLHRHHLVTVSPASDLLWISCGAHRLPLSATYGDVPSGHPVALVGSNGRLEVAVRDGSARDHLGLAAGQPITVTAR